MVNTQVQPDRPERRASYRCDSVAVCDHGHVQAWRLRGAELFFHPRGHWTLRAPRSCRFCGAHVFTVCQTRTCSKPIVAKRTDVRSDDWTLDSYCAYCSLPYPWTMPAERSPDRLESEEAPVQDPAVAHVRRFGAGVIRGTWDFVRPGLQELSSDYIRRKLGLPPN